MAVSLSLFLFSVISRGTLAYPKSFSLAALFGIALVSLVSSFFAAGIGRALVGYGFEIDTALFTVSMFTLTFLVSILFRSRQAIFNFEIALFVPFFILVVYELIRLLFGPEVLSFGFFQTAISTPLGSWNDFGVFAGLMVILSLIAIELLPVSGLFFILLHAVLFAGVLVLSLVNFSALWYVIALFSMFFIIYLLTFQKAYKAEKEKTRRLPFLPIGILFISVLFIFAGNSVGNFIANTFNIDYITVRPSLESTFNIAGEVLKKNPVFGAGPNHFMNEWLLHKPLPVNETIFWNSDFSFGIGLIPSALITMGLLGAFLWVLFIGLLTFESFRTIPKLASDNVGSYAILTASSGALFLFVMDFVYTPGAALYALSFVFVGLLIGVLLGEGAIQERNFDFGFKPSLNFVSVLATVALIILTLVSSYLIFEKTMAFAYGSRSIKAFQAGDLDRTEKYIKKAVDWGKTDLHKRALTDVLIARLGEIVNRKDASADVIRTEFQNTLREAVEAGKAAVETDRSNYQNWLSLGSVYETVVPLKISGAYDNAKAAYEEAMALNPSNPSIQLLLARLEQANGNSVEAKKYIGEALKRKNNYTEAIFLLSQIEVAEGDIKSAINSVEAATVIAPGNPVVFFQLGILRYNNKDYKGAATALERAITLQSSYANARYFLGLAYEKLGKKKEAIAQFEIIEKNNPDNEEVKLILSNLRAGRSPFSNAKPPVDATPEQRKKLPVPEKSSSAVL